jgi:hypothetical protein
VAVAPRSDLDLPTRHARLKPMLDRIFDQRLQQQVRH